MKHERCMRHVVLIRKVPFACTVRPITGTGSFTVPCHTKTSVPFISPAYGSELNGRASVHWRARAAVTRRRSAKRHLMDGDAITITQTVIFAPISILRVGGRRAPIDNIDHDPTCDCDCISRVARLPVSRRHMIVVTARGRPML